MTTDLPGVIQLRAAGVAAVFDVGGPGVPSLLHWGADLGELSPAGLVLPQEICRDTSHDGRRTLAARDRLPPNPLSGEESWS